MAGPGDNLRPMGLLLERRLNRVDRLLKLFLTNQFISILPMSQQMHVSE
jgi:hypothetical protein